MSAKRVAVLGASGSVGRQTLAIAEEHPDRFEIAALQAHSDRAQLLRQIERWQPRGACLTGCDEPPEELRAGVPDGTQLFAGTAGLLAMLEAADPELVVNGITGAAGLEASEWVLQKGRTLALANKESLVIAGGYLLDLARTTGARILPVDSEHCAIHQCLRGNRRESVRRILLTGSGGPFRERPLETFSTITPEEALRHPTWKMGPRITVGSATMMNKAFEILEAHWLFDLAPEEIRVVLHPQSIVHSMVEYTDGSIMAQCGLPDMRVPILYCLAWPDRLPFAFEPFDPVRWARLDFAEVDHRRFPAIELAYSVLRLGGDSGAVLNAADEELTRLFLAGSLPFPAITEIAAEVVQSRTPRPVRSLDDAFAADAEGRRKALQAANIQTPTE